jgi:hypothetical protein
VRKLRKIHSITPTAPVSKDKRFFFEDHLSLLAKSFVRVGNIEAFTTNTDSSVKEKIMFQTVIRRCTIKTLLKHTVNITETNKLCDYSYPTKISTFLLSHAPTTYSQKCEKVYQTNSPSTFWYSHPTSDLNYIIFSNVR